MVNTVFTTTEVEFGFYIFVLFNFILFSVIDLPFVLRAYIIFQYQLTFVWIPKAMVFKSIAKLLATNLIATNIYIIKF
jgi:hypothetical protein